MTAGDGIEPDVPGESASCSRTLLTRRITRDRKECHRAKERIMNKFKHEISDSTLLNYSKVLSLALLLDCGPR